MSKIKYTLAIGIKKFENGEEVKGWWDYTPIGEDLALPSKKKIISMVESFYKAIKSKGGE